MGSICKCGSSLVEYESNLGHSVCVACGEVLEENAIVSEVTFTETGGSSTADGFFVGKNAARAHSKGGNRGSIRTSSIESREQTIANGHRRISDIGNIMKMSDRQIEHAQRYFNLAVIENFTKGRKANSVACACLYIVCRMEKTHMMLIDFSEHLRINVFVLGATFVRLVAALKLFDLPMVEPVLYIVRFANRLEFGDKTQDVIKDANRLVSRMERDWIVRGRRPAGICAACIYIAAKMNGFKRTLREVVTIVKICETTLRRRLNDFKNTPSSNLTVEEFQTVMLEESVDPPSFLHGKKMMKKGIGIEGVLDYDGVNIDSEIENEPNTEEDIENIEEMQRALESEQMRIIAENEGVSLENGGEEDLSFLDDDIEIQTATLSAIEIKIKKRFWEAENFDWERAKQAADAAGLTKTPKRARYKKRESSSSASANNTASSAYEAGVNLLASQKAFSKKINYDLMGSLFLDDSSSNLNSPLHDGEGMETSVTGFGRHII